MSTSRISLAVAGARISDVEEKKFFRLADMNQGGQGLWYSAAGVFTGLIHTKFDFCMNHALPMEFDPDLVGWLSATDVYEDLFHWFSEEDILKLQEFGYRIVVYRATEYRTYRNHLVIKQNSSVLVEVITLMEVENV